MRRRASGTSIGWQDDPVRIRVGWVVMVAMMPTAGCRTTSCKEYAAAALTVRVHAADGSAICDADVVATDGDDVIALEPFPGTDCGYHGAWERPGTYLITATHDGKTATSDRVKVTPGACHVKGKKVDLTLPA